MNTSVRTTGRIKKPKTVYDPSDNYLPRAVLQQQPRPIENKKSHNSSSALSSPEQQKSRVSTGSSDDADTESKKSIDTKKETTTNSGDALVAASPAIIKLPLTDLCYICQKGAAKRGLAARNKLIPCQGCDNKIHKLCLPISIGDVNIDNLRFNCKNCNKCKACEKKCNDDNRQSLMCSKCVSTYHRICLGPSAESKGWQCNDCKETSVMDVEEGEADTSEKTATEAHVSIKDETNTATPVTNGSANTDQLSNVFIKQEKELAEPAVVQSVDSIPDVKVWSVDEVTEYMTKFFPNDGHVFKQEEIDGQSLLLLKRSDVVRKLPIKLGIALRMYELVLKIQTQRNDSTLGWHCPDH